MSSYHNSALLRNGCDKTVYARIIEVRLRSSNTVHLPMRAPHTLCNEPEILAAVVQTVSSYHYGFPEFLRLCIRPLLILVPNLIPTVSIRRSPPGLPRPSLNCHVVDEITFGPFCLETQLEIPGSPLPDSSSVQHSHPQRSRMRKGPCQRKTSLQVYSSFTRSR